MTTDTTGLIIYPGTNMQWYPPYDKNKNKVFLNDPKATQTWLHYFYVEVITTKIIRLSSESGSRGRKINFSILILIF